MEHTTKAERDELQLRHGFLSDVDSLNICRLLADIESLRLGRDSLVQIAIDCDRKHAAERDALKAKLDYEVAASREHMANSLDWKLQRDDARAKLAALVEATVAMRDANVMSNDYEWMSCLEISAKYGRDISLTDVADACYEARMKVDSALSAINGGITNGKDRLV